MTQNVPLEPFTRELRACRDKADMTISDLAIWFDRPWATVKTWVNDARTPAGPAARDARIMLDLLKVAIRHSPGLPVPARMSWRDRTAHVRGIRDAARRNARLSPMRAAV
jgi:hypothetical protein